VGLANGTRPFNPTSRQCVCNIALTLATVWTGFDPDYRNAKIEEGRVSRRNDWFCRPFRKLHVRCGKKLRVYLQKIPAGGESSSIYFLTLSIKRAHLGPFSDEAILLFQPAFNHVRAVFAFPLFQSFVVTAFSLHDFAGVRIFVNLQFARLTSAGCSS